MKCPKMKIARAKGEKTFHYEYPPLLRWWYSFFSLKRLLQASRVNDRLTFVWLMKGSRFEGGDETGY